MANLLHVHNAREALCTAYETVSDTGERVEVRDGLVTRELRAVTITVEDPGDCLVYGVGRRQNNRIAAVEGVQLIAGEAMPSLVESVTPQVMRFSSKGRFHGAYGERIGQQLPHFVEALKEQGSRRALLQIWDWKRDLLAVRDTRDFPCTVFLTGHVRNGKLEFITHMRSNDVWWGLTYDIAQFCMLHVTVAQLLGLEAGTYTHVVDSLHLYERDLGWVTTDTVEREPRWEGVTGKNALDVMDRAWQIATCHPSLKPVDLTPSERWLWNKLHVR